MGIRPSFGTDKAAQNVEIAQLFSVSCHAGGEEPSIGGLEEDGGSGGGGGWDAEEDEAAQEERRRAHDAEYAKYLTASVHINAETNDRSES